MRKLKTVFTGFTLVEIAIVLVIIGLLLGGILKGQELINNAKVRAIADRQSSLKVAWFAFIDRFDALPGDYAQAHIYITGANAGDGNGSITETEAPLVFQHLTVAGFIRCAQCTETATTNFVSGENSLINIYGGVMSIWHDSNWYAAVSEKAANKDPRLMIHTGPRIPSNIIAEVDRKVDDGTPNTGDFVFNRYDPVGKARLKTVQCMKVDPEGKTGALLFSSTQVYWRPANSTPPVWADCGASVFI